MCGRPQSSLGRQHPVALSRQQVLTDPKEAARRRSGAVWVRFPFPRARVKGSGFRLPFGK